jgi:hypothetical protein
MHILGILVLLAHEGALSPQGQPRFLQGMVIASEYADDTVIFVRFDCVLARI